MATKLDELKFNDYTLKGTQSGAITSYTLGPTDRLVDENGHDILWYDSGSSHGWIFHGMSDQAQSVGSIGGTALSYDGDDSVWKFEGVADKALGFMTTTGSNNYMLFNDYLEVPYTAWQVGETATLAEIQAWIENFRENLGENHYLIKISMAQ